MDKGPLFLNLGYRDFIEEKRVLDLDCNSSGSMELCHQAYIEMGRWEGRVEASTVLPEEYQRNLG